MYLDKQSSQIKFRNEYKATYSLSYAPMGKFDFRCRNFNPNE